MFYQLLSDGSSAFDFNSQCHISSTETSHKNLVCSIDVKERDLYHFGADLQVVVPANMCIYTVFRNYWYYNFEVGYGPTTVKIRHEHDDLGNVTGGPFCSVDGGAAQANCPSSIAPATDPYNEVIFDTENNKVSCVYDYSAESGKPNCCLGKYNLVVEDFNSDQLTTDTTTTPDNSWGGDFGGGCTAGTAATDSDWAKSSEKIPLERVYYSKNEGVAINYKIKAPKDIYNEGDNQQVSNWNLNVEGGTEHQHHFGVTTSNLPIALDPITDRSGTALPTAQPSYEIDCLDAAFEVKHVISIYFREYNTDAAWEAFKANPVNGTQNDDVIGNEGVDCDGTIGYSCNDYYDLDDFVPSGDIQPPYGNQCGVTGTSSCFPSVYTKE